MPRTRRDQDIEQVAGIILDAQLSHDEAEATNDSLGWTIEVRYDDGEYTRDTDYTLVEHLRLTPRELTVALSLADDWRQ